MFEKSEAYETFIQEEKPQTFNKSNEKVRDALRKKISKKIKAKSRERHYRIMSIINKNSFTSSSNP